MVTRLSLKRNIVWELEAFEGKAEFAIPINEEQALLYASGTFKREIVKSFLDLTGCRQFVDVGANIGQTMMEIAYSFPDFDYYGFEPNVEAFCCAKSLAEVNRLRVNLFPWACSSAAVPQQFFAESKIDSSATTIASIRPNTYNQIKASSIAAYPLDQVFAERAEHGFILKIDVEGGENEVLRGSQGLLIGKRPLVMCEVLNAHRRSEFAINNWMKKELESILTDASYKIYRIKLNMHDREEFVGIDPIEAFPRNILWKGSSHQCDYVFLPEELQLSSIS